MAEVTLHGRIYRRLLQFQYADHLFGARRTDSGWWIFLDGSYIGTTIDFPFQFAYDYLLNHPEIK